ncbi:MAG: dTDP-glucose 4,6-dehydratase [Oscillospiraceae bacterium]|jgi:dTDP-glucose 4,6-dehydratase|nr:dTDP-glucose 4,6-dehydratase [Oscillospiraceae bacterium]
MKLLVTGAAGFIGANFIYDCLANEPDWNIVIVDKLTYAGNMESLQPILDKVKFVRADICDRPAMEALFAAEDFTAVAHFAAESHVDRSIDGPEVFLRTNALGTQVLLDCARKYGSIRFHQVSTDEVYGDLPLDRPDLFFTEDTPLHCSSPYSASKASADLLCFAYYRTYGLPVTVSRCSNNYGPYQFPEKLIPLMISRALADRPLPVYGTGSNVRDWIHVRDHNRAVRLILKDGKPGEVYNIGGHNERDNLTVVKTILRTLGKPESLITYVADRKGHDRRYAIDPAKMNRELGWLPSLSFDAGIAETIAWYVENKDWWGRILDGTYLQSNAIYM